mmetsp:Transcript_6154/g.17518  ORF Transcript_6154/g.17518 Transcript_6154/m.17518 type:complete len:188 (-) Transcript_6154:400-963(-)
MSYEQQQFGISYKLAWARNDEKIMKDACALWKEAGMIKEEAQGMIRAKALCIVAYDGDLLVAVSTIVLTMEPQVYAKVAQFRCAVRPDYRRRHIATELATRALVTMEQWSAQHPEHKVLAFSIRAEAQDLVLKCYQPVWNNKMNFIGYSQEGYPVYLRWFRHASFGNPNKDPDFTFYPNRPGALGQI